MNTARLINKLKNGSPIALTVVGLIGVIGTAITASRATLKYKEYLDTREQKEDLKEDIKEKAIEAVKIYWPAATICVGTLLSCGGASYLSNKKIAGLSAGYAMIAKGYNDFQKEIESVVGKDPITYSKQQIAKNEYCRNKEAFIYPENDKLTYYEEFRGEFFEVDKATVIEAAYSINRLMASQGFVSLNNYYEFLNLSPIDIGDDLGWSYSVGADFYGYSWVDVEYSEFELEDGLNAIEIIFPCPPITGYMN